MLPFNWIFCTEASEENSQLVVFLPINSAIKIPTSPVDPISVLSLNMTSTALGSRSRRSVHLNAVLPVDTLQVIVTLSPGQTGWYEGDDCCKKTNEWRNH